MALRRHATRSSSPSSTTFAPASWNSCPSVRTANPPGLRISPDGKTIVFARNHNLYMMDAANYAKAQEERERQDPSSKPRSPPTAKSTSLTAAAVSAEATSSNSRNSSRGIRKARARTRRPRSARQCLLVAGFEEVRARPPRSAQDARSVGDQLAGEAAPDARNLPLRHARRSRTCRRRSSKSSTWQRNSGCW